MSAPRVSAGFALLPVVLALALIAAIAFALTRETSGGTGRVRAAEQGDLAGYVAEAGLRHALWLAHQGTCSGYGLPPTPFGAHSYKATFTPTAGSPVSVNAVGTLANGLSHSLVRDAQTMLDGIQSESLALPGGGDDTYLDVGFPDANFGGGATLGLSYGSQERRPLLRFDLSGVPNGAHVISARMSLHYQGASSVGPDASVEVRPVTRSWVEGSQNGGGSPDGATWNDWDGSNSWSSPGGDAEPAPSASAPLPATPGSRVGWDVTRLVQQWVDGTRPNHGLQLRSDDAIDLLAFSSGESSQASQRPRLQVFYGCECGGGTPVTAVLRPGTSGVDTYLDDGSPTTNWGGSSLIRISNKTNAQKRGLLRFDLGSIDPTASVASAELELYLEGIGSAAPATIDVHRVLRSWNESGATWQQASSGTPWTTPGGDYDPTVEASADIDPLFPGATTWDVTALAADWIADPGANQGIALLGSPEVNHADFDTSDVNSVARRPKLTVTYGCGCGVCQPPDLYLDEFRTRFCSDAVDFAGSHGSLDWSPTPWQRVGESSSSPCSGQVRIVGVHGFYEVQFGGDVKGLQREVDLSMFSNPGLELSYLREGLDAAAQALVVQASTDGVGWVEIGRIMGPSNDSIYREAQFDLSAFATATSFIRLMGEGLGSQGANTHYVYIDDVRIRQLPPTPPGPEQLILIPDADTHIDQNDPATAFGSDASLDTGADAGWKRYRTLLRFDPTSLPAGATVVSAVLRTYAHNLSGNQDSLVGVYGVNAAWDEATSTWNSTGGQPFDPASPLAQSLVDWSTLGWVEWSIPPGLIHEWVDGLTPNHGLLLEYQGTKKNQRMRINSREHWDAPRQPQLVIDYTTP